MSVDVAADAMDDAPRRRDIVSCPATWSPDLKGYIRVVHPTTGEVCEIPAKEATPVWKEDLDRLRQKRAAQRSGRNRS